MDPHTHKGVFTGEYMHVHTNQTMYKTSVHMRRDVNKKEIHKEIELETEIRIGTGMGIGTGIAHEERDGDKIKDINAAIDIQAM